MGSKLNKKRIREKLRYIDRPEKRKKLQTPKNPNQTNKQKTPNKRETTGLKNSSEFPNEWFSSRTYSFRTQQIMVLSAQLCSLWVCEVPWTPLLEILASSNQTGQGWTVKPLVSAIGSRAGTWANCRTQGHRPKIQPPLKAALARPGFPSWGMGPHDLPGLSLNFSGTYV